MRRSGFHILIVGRVTGGGEIALDYLHLEEMFSNKITEIRTINKKQYTKLEKVSHKHNKINEVFYQMFSFSLIKIS